MAVRDFSPRPQGATPDSVPHQNWLDALGDRQNIDLQQELISVDSADELLIFDASETGPVKTKKVNVSNLAAAMGGVVQIVDGTPYTTYDSTTASIPNDDSIPQSGEGKEYVTVTITPTSASNKLRIEAIASAVSADAARTLTAALFQDSVANAIAVGQVTVPSVNYLYPMILDHWQSAGTTSAITFKLRIGVAAGGTAYINGNTANRTMGGVNSVRIRATEYA